MDSTEETIRHIVRVKEFMNMVAMELARRGAEHDRSKLNEPEKSIFDEMTPKLKTSTYGSEEYKGFLREMKVALDHHYENNRHHPEHSEKGIEGMDLIDLIECYCDWAAASERHENGSLKKSLEVNRTRFNIGDQLLKILENTRPFFGK